jgi:hypothetical protein
VDSLLTASNFKFYLEIFSECNQGHGTLKFLHCSPKWTNPRPTTFESDTYLLTSRSIPWDPNNGTNVPKTVVDTVKEFILANLPELIGCDTLIAKLCWDSFAIDLDFVMDWVPEIENCIIVAGGSGHGMYPVFSQFIRYPRLNHISRF